MIEPSSAAQAVATSKGNGVVEAWWFATYARLKSSVSRASCIATIATTAPASMRRPGLTRSADWPPRDPDPAPDQEDGSAECGDDPGGPEQGEHQVSG